MAEGCRVAGPGCVLRVVGDFPAPVVDGQFRCINVSDDWSALTFWGLQGPLRDQKTSISGGRPPNAQN